MGVGSEVYGSVINKRRGVGIELKEAYYRQALANLAQSEGESEVKSSVQPSLFGEEEPAEV